MSFSNFPPKDVLQSSPNYNLLSPFMRMTKANGAQSRMQQVTESLRSFNVPISELLANVQLSSHINSSIQNNICFDEAELVAWTKMNILGKGSYGTVYEGITNDGKMMAVKVQELPSTELTEGNGGDEANASFKALQDEINLMK